LLSGTQNEVDDHVWGELLDFFSVVGKRIPIGANTQNTIGNSRGGGTAMQNRHLVTGIGQFADQERADETVAANDENSHMDLKDCRGSGVSVLGVPGSRKLGADGRIE